MAEQRQLELFDVSGTAWVRLAGGAFQMGSLTGRDDAKSIREVRLSPFLLSTYPVTNAEYALFARATSRTPPDNWSADGIPGTKPDHPVTYVSWEDAQAFCRWLTDACNDAASGRAHLPTEAQWEFAARGNHGREYPWGSEQPTPEHTNYQESGIEDTAPVGAHRKGATPEGVHDLAGNVRHWCLDWYAPSYIVEDTDDPLGPDTGRERVLRGGSFVDAPATLRAGYRFNTDPTGRYGFVGFRVAWSETEEHTQR